MNRIEFYLKLDKFKAEDKKAKEEAAKGEVIMHYGIPNMKWGQRRWQNADGTFNEEGKQRYFGKGSKEKIGSQADKNKKVGGWYMDSIENARITPKTASERAVADLRVNDRIKNETIDSFENSKKNRLAKIMDGDYFDRLNRMQSALSKGKTEKYNKLLNKFKEEDRELVEDYVKKLNDNINDHRDSYLYDFNNNKEKFYAEIKAREERNAQDKIDRERAAENEENGSDQKIGATGIVDAIVIAKSVVDAVHNYGDVQDMRKNFTEFMNASDQEYSEDERLSVMNNKKKIAKLEYALATGDDALYNKTLKKVKDADKAAVEKIIKDINEKDSKAKVSDENQKILDEHIGSISKPKINKKYLNADGTLNENYRNRMNTNRKASDVASSVFLALRNINLFEAASVGLGGLILSFTGFGIPVALAGALASGVIGGAAAIDNSLYKKLEKRADAYYELLN